MIQLFPGTEYWTAASGKEQVQCEEEPERAFKKKQTKNKKNTNQTNQTNKQKNQTKKKRKFQNYHKNQEDYICIFIYIFYTVSWSMMQDLVMIWASSGPC